ncbi:cation transporter [Ottowia sp.]|uniref:cation transporter n=1 Tax=Ottowia sp. TaxID=1898956 RepID=UPI003A84B108
MSASCCAPVSPGNNPRYRRVLWVALVVNAAMFGVELLAGWAAGSVALLADAIDFFGDAVNYGLSLAVLGMALATRAKAALFKAACMAAFGVFVLGRAAWSVRGGIVPEAMTMGVVATLALVANVAVAWLLYHYRSGDANMRSVWICSRNDAIGNVAVALAALGVLGTGTAWPDLMVAALMALLGITGAWAVGRQAWAELRGGSTTTAAAVEPGCCASHEHDGMHAHEN